MISSPTITKLAQALVKAQPKIGGARKDKLNPHFRSKYADLASVAEAIDAAIPEYGLSYVQCAHDKESAAAVETIILHESGEWMSCGVVSVPVSKADAQGFGSALTYARRYSLSSAFGVVPEDDDGNAAAAAAPRKAEVSPLVELKQDAFEALDPEEQKFLRTIAADTSALLDEKRDAEAHAHLEAQKLDTEEKLAIWFLFNSKQRSSLKAASEQARRKAVA